MADTGKQKDKKRYTTILHKYRKLADLSLLEYCVVDMIHGLQNNPTHPGWCYASRQFFADELGYSKMSILRTLASLVNKGFIKQDTSTNYLQTTEKWYIEVQVYRDNPDKKIEPNEPNGNKMLPKEQNKTGNKMLPQVVTKCYPDGNKMLPNNNIYNNNNNKKNKSGLEKQEPDSIPYKEIIDYLNWKAGTKYKYGISSTNNRIKTRWGEGFKLEDFKQAIDNCCREWLNNPDMKKYLRPQTLFGTKFESYVNISTVSSVGFGDDDLPDNPGPVEYYFHNIPNEEFKKEYWKKFSAKYDVGEKLTREQKEQIQEQIAAEYNKQVQRSNNIRDD